MRVALVIAGAIVSLALVPSAQALTLSRADLEGTNGYEIRIDAVAGSVTVAAKDDGAGARYTAEGSVGREHIRADLGRFGTVDLEFEPGAKSNCRRAFKVRRGTWTGSVQFVAEAGFTAASVTSAPGQTLRESRSCARRRRGDDSDAAFLLVNDRNPLAQRETFVAASRVPGRRSNIFASLSRTENGVQISDFATDRVGRSRFRYDRERRRAMVRPHQPFSGAAEVRGRKWRGDLTATMPALGEVPLTGPGFRATFETLDLGRPFAP
jgi:hypothetical protein